MIHCKLICVDEGTSSLWEKGIQKTSLFGCKNFLNFMPNFFMSSPRLLCDVRLGPGLGWVGEGNVQGSQCYLLKTTVLFFA